jgi:nucleoside-diphosphate-sugar epimerase
MAKVLITGVSGTIGSVLAQKIVQRGDEVWGLSRHWGQNDSPPDIHPLSGDVTHPNLGLGLDDLHWHCDSVYHCAGLINLGKNTDELLLNTNVNGAKNVVDFCKRYDIPHLYFVSTAYAGLGHNFYEDTKAAAEKVVMGSGIPKVTIFKPSIVLSSTDGHFSRFIETLIMIHRRADLIRRKVEDTLRLPVIEPVFRIKGNSDGCLNLVMADDVAQAMSVIQTEGTWWLTNPYPSTLKELGEMVGKVIMVRLEFMQQFHAMPLEAAFEKIARSFLPYLKEDLPPHDSYLPFQRIDQDFIESYIKRLIYRS